MLGAGFKWKPQISRVKEAKKLAPNRNIMVMLGNKKVSMSYNKVGQDKLFRTVGFRFGTREVVHTETHFNHTTL